MTMQHLQSSQNNERGNSTMVPFRILLSVVLSLYHMAQSVNAFSTESRLSVSSANDEAGTVYPPLSRDEVRSLLDNVPLYAVTEPSQDGLVLLKEKDNPREQANFFFSPENANAKYAPFRKDNPLANWDITQYPLGLVWFELIAQENQDVDYRLVPNEFELVSARNIVQRQKSEVDLFQAGYNEIPVFWDTQLRVQTAYEQQQQEKQRFPLYFGYQNMLTAVRRASAASGATYQPTISVMDLKSLIGQMMELESPFDFRNAVFVPPSLSEKEEIPATKDLWTD